MQSCLIPCCHCSQAVLPHGHPTGCATPPGPAPGASQTSWWNRPSIPLPDLQPQQLLLKTLLLLPANTSTPSHMPVWKQNSQGQAVFSEQQISLEQTLGKKHLYFTSIKNDVYLTSMCLSSQYRRHSGAVGKKKKKKNRHLCTVWDTVQLEQLVRTACSAPSKQHSSCTEELAVFYGSKGRSSNPACWQEEAGNKGSVLR